MNSWTEDDPRFVRRRYNRLASIYVFFEWLFWLPSGMVRWWRRSRRAEVGYLLHRAGYQTSGQRL